MSEELATKLVSVLSGIEIDLSFIVFVLLFMLLFKRMGK